MSDERSSERERLARRASLVDGIPVVVLGGLALALGSSGDTGGGQEVVWLVTSVTFTLAVAWALVRGFRRADEFQRKIQLESMAVAFGVTVVALQIAGLLDAAGIGELRQSLQLIVIGGIAIWFLLADRRMRSAR